MSEASSASEEGSESSNPGGATVLPVDVAQDGSEPSPPEPIQDVKEPASSSTADGTPSETEGDEGAKEPESLVDALEKAIEKDKQDAESPPAGSEDQKSDAKAEEKPDAKAEDGDETLPPFHLHPRWQEKMAELSKATDQVAELTSQVEGLTEAGEAIDRLESFLKTNNLQTDEFNTLLQIGALMRNDPAKALEALTPYYSQLLEITGTILPPDIQQAVNEGLVTEDYGKQLAKTRAGEQIATHQMALQTSQQEANTSTQLVDALSTHATAWENTWAASDPDYEKKAELVREGIELRLLRGDIPDGQEAVIRMCDEEKSKVEKRMRGFVPTPKPLTPSPGSSGGPSNIAPSAPTSMMEAMEQAIAAGPE